MHTNSYIVFVNFVGLIIEIKMSTSYGLICFFGLKMVEFYCPCIFVQTSLCTSSTSTTQHLVHTSYDIVLLPLFDFVLYYAALCTLPNVVVHTTFCTSTVLYRTHCLEHKTVS